MLKMWRNIPFSCLSSNSVKLVQLTALLAVFMVSLPNQGRAESIFRRQFPYQANEADVRLVLNDLSRKTGLITKIDESILATVTVRNTDGSVEDLLDNVLIQANATWWYDGTVLHVEPTANLTTVFMDPMGLSQLAIERGLENLDLLDPHFPLQTTPDGAVLRINGPAEYVEQVVSLVTAMMKVRRIRAGTEDDLGWYLPHVYRGRTQ